MPNFFFQHKKWTHDPECLIGTLKNYQVYEMYLGKKAFYYVIINESPRFLEDYEIKHIQWNLKKNYKHSTKQKSLFSFI